MVVGLVGVAGVGGGMGLVGMSGCTYWMGLPAAPLIGLLAVTLKYSKYCATIRKVLQRARNALQACKFSLCHQSQMTNLSNASFELCPITYISRQQVFHYNVFTLTRFLLVRL